MSRTFSQEEIDQAFDIGFARGYELARTIEHEIEPYQLYLKNENKDSWRSAVKKEQQKNDKPTGATPPTTK